MQLNIGRAYIRGGLYPKKNIFVSKNKGLYPGRLAIGGGGFYSILLNAKRLDQDHPQRALKDFKHECLRIFRIKDFIVH